MLALYGSGRQAEALERYAAGRRALAEELGIEPGGALKDLERRILVQDPGLAPPAREGSRARPATAAASRPRRRPIAPWRPRALIALGAAVLAAGAVLGSGSRRAAATSPALRSPATRSPSSIPGPAAPRCPSRSGAARPRSR